MSAILICVIAFAASALTFFSGFGLGTLLLPAFALFHPIEVAVASTGVVHFLNGLFKLSLVGRHADRRTVLRFGVPAIAAALLGAWLLFRLAATDPVVTYSIFGVQARIVPAKLAVGFLLLALTALELSPRYESLALPTRYVPLGGLLSGFFGGISGMQGALRSAFLIRLGLSKECYIGTGVVIAMLIDLSRLGVYAEGLAGHRADLDYPLVASAVVSALLGAVLGHRILGRATIRTVHRIVGLALILVAVGLIGGVI
jgi:hypothetical protein